MRLAVFDDFRVGVVDGDQLYDVTAAVPDAWDGWPEQRVNWLIRTWEAGSADKIVKLLGSGAAAAFSTSGVTLRASSPAPQHVFALPANYVDHIGELGSRSVSKGRSARLQGFFLKAPGSLTGAGGDIRLPRASTRRFDHECELAVVIGQTARNVHRDDALRYVFGYSTLIDLTMRIEKGEFEEERSMRKSFDTFTPLGPWIVTADEIDDIDAVSSRLWVNDQLKQSTTMDKLIVGIGEAIELISSVTTLSPGDVIAMGTPAGVGPVNAGDTVRIEIDGVGAMSLPVLEQAERSPRAY